MTATKARVIILWSHPRSCVASLVQAGWAFPYASFSSQLILSTFDTNTAARPCSRWPSCNVKSSGAAATLLKGKTGQLTPIHHVPFTFDTLYRVLHEPLGEPYYYGPQRMSNRFTAEKRQEDFRKYAELTFEREWSNIVQTDSQGTTRTFVKDMAQYIIPPVTSAPTTPSLPSSSSDGNPTVIPTSQLLSPDVTHAFLVRTPEKAVPSYYRLCIPPKSGVTGFEYFEPEEVGIRESKMLYDWLVKMGQKPMLIDAADLLANPGHIMEMFCKSSDVDFTHEMCDWEGGEQEHFKKWAGFHDDAQNSTGIAKPGGGDSDHATKEAKKAKEAAEMPESVQRAIADNMEEYRYLSAKASR